MGSVFTWFGLTDSREKEVKKFILIFYLVAVVGMIVPFSRPLFILLTPLALVLNFFLLLAYHRGGFSLLFVLTAGGIYLVGFFLEVVGVHTGLLFGAYAYGQGLGVKLWDTPLLIGLNWLFLSYTASTVVQTFLSNKYLQIGVASLAMLVYDMVLEQVAPWLDFWHWQGGVVPIQNYVAWFSIALVFNTLLFVQKKRWVNQMSGILFVAQFVFFVLLWVLK